MENKKVIFVCTGNTCRSPIAEAILKSKLKNSGINNIIVSSAGLMAEVGKLTNEKSVLALKQLGIIIRRKKAKQLTKKIVTKNCIIITMTQNQKEYVKNLAQCYALQDFDSGIDLTDPYGKDFDAYLNCAKILDFVVQEIYEKLCLGVI